MQVEFIRLPVKFANATQSEMDQNQSIFGQDWEPELIDGFKYFNVNQICNFNEDTEGDVTLSTTAGDMKIYMKFEEFIKLSVFKILK